MSKDLLYELIEALTILPGVGKKSAQLNKILKILGRPIA